MNPCLCGDDCHRGLPFGSRMRNCHTCVCLSCRELDSRLTHQRAIHDWNYHIGDKDRLKITTHIDALGCHYMGRFHGPDGQIVQQLVIVDKYYSQMVRDVRGAVMGHMCGNFAKLCQETYGREALQELIDVAKAVEALAYHWRMNPRNRMPAHLKKKA